MRVATVAAVEPIVERARAIAEDVLFPAAPDTDGAELLPVSHLDLLAREGFYGVSGPADAGGLDLDPPTTCAVVEALASGCLTTAFVWLQHRNPVRAVAASATPVSGTSGSPRCAPASDGPASRSPGTARGRRSFARFAAATA